MKTEISSLELHFLLKELEPLAGGKIEQIYQVGKEEFVLQLHITGLGKRIVRIILGKIMYVASHKGEMPEKPPGFCLYLRKKLKNARLRSVSQLGFERIVEFVFETKEAQFKLVVELFSKGNIILCNGDGVILSVLEAQEWKDRIVKPKELYKYPKKDFDFLQMSESDFSAMLDKSDKESLVKSLAIDLGLGGIYAEELCSMSGVDKKIKPNQLTDKEKQSIYSSSREMIGKAISPVVIFEDAEKAVVKDVVPFMLDAYKTLLSNTYQSINESLDVVFTEKLDKTAIDSAVKASKTKADKIRMMVSQQTMRMEGLEKAEKENQRKAELIYENYMLVSPILSEINSIRKTISWEEIKKRFKDHKIIKDINEKTGEITVEL